MVQVISETIFYLLPYCRD
uniref:Uncharacterized protein n=1 Tax=Arundo donax TaxID=35708 RepID=A0A0A9AP11_ARUDO